MSLRPYKFVVQAVVQEVETAESQKPTGSSDKTFDVHLLGEVVTGEHQSEPVVLYGCDALAAWANEFPEKLAAAAVKE